jgi:hypothetical protein
MFLSKTRTAVVLCGMAVVLAGFPAKSHAIFDWLCPWSKKQQTATTTYVPPYSGRPVVAAPAAIAPPVVVGVPAVGAAMPTTCSYVPQTCYRTVYRPMPVTSCTPVTCYDPCTGCPRVSYRPVRTYAYRAMMVPYTTYRVVYSNPCCPTTTWAGGYGVSGAVAAPACSGCASSVGAASTVAPMPVLPSSTPASPYAGTTAPPLAPSALSPVPGTYPGDSRPSTFAPGPQESRPATSAVAPSGSAAQGSSGGSLPWPQTRLSPVAPQGSGTTLPKLPPLSAPNDRTTTRPVRQASYASPATPVSEGVPGITVRRSAAGWEPVK